MTTETRLRIKAVLISLYVGIGLLISVPLYMHQGRSALIGLAIIAMLSLLSTALGSIRLTRRYYQLGANQLYSRLQMAWWIAGFVGGVITPSIAVLVGMSCFLLLSDFSAGIGSYLMIMGVIYLLAAIVGSLFCGFFLVRFLIQLDAFNKN